MWYAYAFLTNPVGFGIALIISLVMLGILALSAPTEEQSAPSELDTPA